MTKEQKRIAIAKCCTNWTYHHGGKYCAITNCPDGTLQGRLFDPLTDLNAMRVAEGELTLDERDKYAQVLTEMFHGPGWSFALIHASGEHRAEAFLKTLGLVDEPEPGIEWKVK